MAEYQDLMRRFAEHVGLENADVFLEHNLLIVDGLPVHFSEQAGDLGPEIWYFSPLGPMPIPARPEHYLKLLEANDFWIDSGGATISLQKDTGQARLSARQPLAAATVNTLAVGVGRLAGAALHFQKVIKEMGTLNTGGNNGITAGMGGVATTVTPYDPPMPNLA